MLARSRQNFVHVLRVAVLMDKQYRLGGRRDMERWHGAFCDSIQHAFGHVGRHEHFVSPLEFLCREGEVDAGACRIQHDDRLAEILAKYRFDALNVMSTRSKQFVELMWWQKLIPIDHIPSYSFSTMISSRVKQKGRISGSATLSARRDSPRNIVTIFST